MPQIYDMGLTALLLPPKEGVLRGFSLLKIRRLRPGLNPRTWVLKASTLPPRPPKTLIIIILGYGDWIFSFTRKYLNFFLKPAEAPTKHTKVYCSTIFGVSWNTGLCLSVPTSLGDTALNRYTLPVQWCGVWDYIICPSLVSVPFIIISKPSFS